VKLQWVIARKKTVGSVSGLQQLPCGTGGKESFYHTKDPATREDDY